jgi:glycosyltransferase involved in cell wall biosynthesis
MIGSPKVSVIITCYNHASFLDEAIQSVLEQSFQQHEIIVIDDGSTDQSSEIAARYSEVRLIRQKNQGLSAARNAGITASRGEYVVFLDADDRLLSHALETGADRLDAHEECAFAYGRYRLITADSKPIPWAPRHSIQGEPYLRLLVSNYIGMHAVVMYRRTIFEEVGGFNRSLAACEDYEMYLRITRNHPIYCHNLIIADYRQHNANMSLNTDLMLKTSISVLNSQRKYARGNKRAKAAYRAGITNWQEYYGKKLLKAMRVRVSDREWKSTIKGAVVLLRYYPGGVAHKTVDLLTRLTARAPRLFSIKAFR